jgi:hypothetical protein
MTLARAALALALILPAAAHARGLLDTHFRTGGCFVRSYSAQHLAKHPDQLVRFVSLAPVPLADPPGVRLMLLTVNLRGSEYYMSGLANCRERGPALACQMEGDAGGFVLEPAKDGAVRLSVGRNGVHFEGAEAFHSLSATSGDDRVFVLPNVHPDQCS